MKLGIPQYVAWWMGGPCVYRPTLNGAIKAAQACEARGGAKHKIMQLRLVKVTVAPTRTLHRRSER